MMRNPTRCLNWAHLFGLLLWLLCLPQFSMAQRAQRPGPDDGPVELCLPAYGQKNGATYVAANHLSGSYGPADIGATGVNTVIDVNASYGGTVVFNGFYHVRGNVRFINGTVDLQPGTVFYVEGLSGQSTPPTPVLYPFTGIGMDGSTFIEVANANLELTGATIMAACQRAWSGINLLGNGRIRTRPDPAAVAPAGRCAIRDAFIGVNATAQSGQFSTAEYYLSNTDFLNNYVGVYDYYKAVARAGEGAHYCVFGTDTGLKSPLKSMPRNLFTGIWLGPLDQPIGYNNYAAASIDHCNFHHLDNGVYGEGELLHISSNTFDYIWYAAINQEGAQAQFDMKPMTVEQNNIMVRGTNPRGNPTTWGILGSPYATGNYIHGDDANPAGNSVTQVGMFMQAPDNSTQSGNTFERLDQGIEASVDNAGTRQRDISGNMFRDVVAGISFYTYISSPMSPGNLFVRCNSFENPGSLAGAVALKVEGPNFPSAIGSSSNGNGNRFVTPGLPFIEPIDNSLGNSSNTRTFNYWRFGSSNQEDFSQASILQRGITYTDLPTGGNPATACISAGYANGTNNRSAVIKPSIDPAELQNAYDSLILSTISVNRRDILVHTVITAVSEQQAFANLETYVADLPLPANAIHAVLGRWLLYYYRTMHRELDVQRVRAALLARHAADSEVSSFVQLSDVLPHLSRSALPTKTDLAILRQVAASGTASARVACPVARRYEPTCPCLFSAKGLSGNLATNGEVNADKSFRMGIPYPNPACEQVMVPYFFPLGYGPVHLELRNVLGQLVHQVPLPNESGEALLAVGQLPTGLYQVALVGEGRQMVTQRLVVTH